MLDDMKLRWRRAKKQDVYLNSEKNILLLQVFAEKMLHILEGGKHIINFDESLFSSTTGRSYTWEKRGPIAGRNFKRETSGISIMRAIISDGRLFFQFLDVTNQSNSVRKFLLG